MIRLLPRTPRGTWLLAGVVWLAGVGALWWALPYRPRAAWEVGPQQIYVGFIPDRRAFVTYSFQLEVPSGGPLSFWEADSGRRVEWFDADERINTAALSPNGAWLALAHGRKESGDKFQLFDTATGRVRSDLPVREGTFVNRPCFSPDSRWLAYCEVHTDRDRVTVWDVDAGRLGRTFRPALQRSKLPTERFEPAFRVAFSPGGSLLAVGEDACEPTKAVTHIELWDWESGRVVRTLSGPTSVGSCRLQFSPDGAHVVAEFDERILNQSRYHVRCWNLSDGRETLQVQGRIAAVTPDLLWIHALDPTKPLLQVTQAWEYSGRRLREITAIGGLAPDARTLVYASSQPHPVRDWVTARGIRWPFSQSEVVQRRLIDVETEQVIAELPAWIDRSQVTAHGQVGFSPDGQLYAEPIDGGIRVWDIPPHKPLAWFATCAFLLALPPLLIARRRARRLRREAAA